MTAIIPKRGADPEAAARRALVPAYYRKGERQNWHQQGRHAAVLTMLKGLSGRVLDYGCGYGDLAFAMSREHEVCGVDLDPERVAFAQQEYEPIEFQHCSVENAPYDDASFEIVTSIVVINFIADASGHLRSIRRLLKPGGHLLLACRNVEAVRDTMRKLIGRGPAPRKVFVRPREEMRLLLRDNGFAILKESWFYDPPFLGWKNAGDYLVGSMEQLLSLAGVSATAGYFLMLAKVQK